MNIDKNLYSGRPENGCSETENAIYDALDALEISFARAVHDYADTMEDCLAVEAVLGAEICKNLFLCNRQKTCFYMVMMPGAKPFRTKHLSAQLDCARLSFADSDKMAELLHTSPGSVSALELIFDTDKQIQLVIDKDLLKNDFISGHPGISTSTLRLSREDMLRYISASGHTPVYVDLPVETE